METCPRCKEQFEGDVGEDELSFSSHLFDCPYCGHRFSVDNIDKIVWRKDDLSDTWYTCLVPRHTKVDGVRTRRFEYYDYMKGR
jgi:DNA-directed RNA polymerase subunit RPC12/RpoP